MELLHLSEGAHSFEGNSVLHRYISECVNVFVRAGDGVAGQGIRCTKVLTSTPACCEDVERKFFLEML